jgi:outer membrane protein OmpA-like peptidoglycan-associated protein
MSLPVARRAVAVGVLALAAWLVPGTAAAQETPDPQPDLEFAPKPAGTPSTFPVEDWAGAVEDIAFPVASADGAVVDGGDNTFELASDVLFEFDRSDLTPRATDELTAIAEKITASGAAGSPITVVGHTDDVGEDAYNQRLSTDRAESVRAALAAALGPQANVTATGRGESEPIADNATPQGQSRNRRVEITVG